MNRYLPLPTDRGLADLARDLPALVDEFHADNDEAERRYLESPAGKVYLAMSEALDRMARDTDFASGMAVLRTRGILLGKKVI